MIRGARAGSDECPTFSRRSLVASIAAIVFLSSALPASSECVVPFGTPGYKYWSLLEGGDDTLQLVVGGLDLHGVGGAEAKLAAVNGAATRAVEGWGRPFGRRAVFHLSSVSWSDEKPLESSRAFVLVHTSGRQDSSLADLDADVISDPLGVVRYPDLESGAIDTIRIHRGPVWIVPEKLPPSDVSEICLGQASLACVIGHELGHLLGVGHSAGACEPSGSCMVPVPRLSEEAAKGNRNGASSIPFHDVMPTPADLAAVSMLYRTPNGDPDEPMNNRWESAPLLWEADPRSGGCHALTGLIGSTFDYDIYKVVCIRGVLPGDSLKIRLRAPRDLSVTLRARRPPEIERFPTLQAETAKFFPLTLATPPASSDSATLPAQDGALYLAVYSEEQSPGYSEQPYEVTLELTPRKGALATKRD